LIIRERQEAGATRTASRDDGPRLLGRLFGSAGTTRVEPAEHRPASMPEQFEQS